MPKANKGRENPKEHVCVRCGAICCRPGTVGSRGIHIQPHEHEVREAARRRGVLRDPGTIDLKGELCAALQGKRCTIHDNKPLVCKVHPFDAIRPGMPLFKASGGCLGVEELVANNPKSLVAMRGRLFLKTKDVLKDEMLGESLRHAMSAEGVRRPFDMIWLENITESWLENPAITTRIRELESEGHKFKWKHYGSKGL